jgi:ferritin
MKMSESLETAYSDQITLELESSIAYLQLAAWFDGENLPGMSRWMALQSEEERGHALRFLRFALDRGNAVRIREITAPTAKFTDPAAAFEHALEHERGVTAAIRGLYELASKENDFESFPLLQAFLTEQVEEEATAQEILGRLRRIGADGSALLLLDQELGGRPGQVEAGPTL